MNIGKSIDESVCRLISRKIHYTLHVFLHNSVGFLMIDFVGDEITNRMDNSLDARTWN